MQRYVLLILLKKIIITWESDIKLINILQIQFKTDKN